MADISTWLHIKSQCQTNTTADFSTHQIVSDKILRDPMIFSYSKLLRSHSHQQEGSMVKRMNESAFETEMQNFRHLLNKVREIMDGMLN